MALQKRYAPDYKRGGGDVGKQLSQKAKKLHPMTTFLVVVFLAIGLWLGVTVSRAVTAGDCFVLNGQQEYVIAPGSTVSYLDEGVTAISFGQDMSEYVSVKTNMEKNEDGTYHINTEEPGTYYIAYTIDNWRFSGIQKVRTFTVGGGES